MGLVIVLVAILALRDGRHEAEPRDAATLRPRPAAAAAALHRFAAAVEAADPQAARDAAPVGDTVAAELLTALAVNAGRLSVADLSARYLDDVGTTASDGSWTGAVELTWRFEGFDRGPARSEVLVRFAGAGDDAGVIGFGGGEPASGRRTPLWLQGPLAVVGDDRRVVLVDGTAAEAREIAQRVDEGIKVVRRMLPEWQPRVVVEVPAAAAELDETLGASHGTYAGIAAVTAPVDGTMRDSSPVHVFLNPDASGALRPAGARVVMSHELAHLATGAATSSVEGWLLEGFADYVALRGLNLPDHTALGRAIALARKSGVPDHLPGPAEFDSRAEELDAAYEQAWLACRIVAERLGERGLLALYRAVDRGVPLGRGLRQAGLPESELLREWRLRLQDLAG